LVEFIFEAIIEGLIYLFVKSPIWVKIITLLIILSIGYSIYSLLN